MRSHLSLGGQERGWYLGHLCPPSVFQSSFEVTTSTAPFRSSQQGAHSSHQQTQPPVLLGTRLRLSELVLCVCTGRHTTLFNMRSIQQLCKHM